MSKRRALPTTQIINDFNALADNEKAIVFDYITSQTAARPKSAPASPAVRRSSPRQRAAASTVSTPVEPVSVGSVASMGASSD